MRLLLDYEYFTYYTIYPTIVKFQKARRETRTYFYVYIYNILYIYYIYIYIYIYRKREKKGEREI